MRALWIVLFAVGCGDDLVGSSEDPSLTLRERLAHETSLAVSPDSAGGVTAGRYTSDGWQAGFVDIAIESGELAVLAEPSGALLVERLELDLAPIELPPSLIHDAALTEIHVSLAAPTRADATWIDANEGRAETRLPIELSWSLTIEDSTSPVGAPTLPPVPMQLSLYGGDEVHAELRLVAPGELWSWADLVRLEDLQLILVASTQGQVGN